MKIEDVVYNSFELTRQEYDSFGDFINLVNNWLFDTYTFKYFRAGLYSEVVKKKIGNNKVNLTERGIVGSIKVEAINKKEYEVIFYFELDKHLQYTLWENGKYLSKSMLFSIKDEFKVRKNLYDIIEYLT